MKFEYFVRSQMTKERWHLHRKGRTGHYTVRDIGHGQIYYRLCSATIRFPIFIRRMKHSIFFKRQRRQLWGRWIWRENYALRPVSLIYLIAPAINSHVPEIRGVIYSPVSTFKLYDRYVEIVGGPQESEALRQNAPMRLYGQYGTGLQ